MLKNYLKIAWRNLFRNQLSSIINIAGLSVAIGCSIVVFTFIEFSLNRDNFHEHAKEIFVVESVLERSGNQQTWGNTPPPLARALKEDFPQIKRVVRLQDDDGYVRSGDKVLENWIRWVDPEFLEMFTFPLAKGDPAVLQDPTQLVLSEETAVKFFGEDDPMGKPLTITFADSTQKTFYVGGVAEKISPRATVDFQILANIQTFLEMKPKFENNWRRFMKATLVQVEDPAQIPSIIAGLEPYIKIQNEARQDWPIKAFIFDNLLTISHHSHEIRGDISSGTHRAAYFTLFAIGLFLLLLACFNYINIAIASAARRLKEIGIRKVIGGSRKQLVVQFLTENLLICMVALVLGMALAQYFLMPGFNYSLNDGEAIPISYDLPALWVFLLIALLFTALAAGAYPAFFVSAFKPVTIFRGKQKLGGKNLLSRILLVTQFVLSFILIAAGVVFTQNAKYQAQTDWGYDQNHKIIVPVKSPSQYYMIRDAAKKLPGIEAVSGGGGHIGGLRFIDVATYQGKEYEFSRFDMGHGYIEAMGLRVKQGRPYDARLATDRYASLVNETLVRQMGWEEPLGKQFNMDTVTLTVIGVLEDFHHEDFNEPIEPVFTIFSEEDEYRFLVAKAIPGQGKESFDALQSAWAASVSDFPFEGYFQDTEFDGFFRENNGIANVFVAVSLMALLLSCMGLFGLVALNVAQRMKEFSIRKVLGATMFQLSQLINRQFAWMLGIALVIAIPAGFFLLKMLLGDIFSYHIPLTLSPFLLTGGILVITALLTISSHLVRVAKANPVDALREE